MDYWTGLTSTVFEDSPFWDLQHIIQFKYTIGYDIDWNGLSIQSWFSLTYLWNWMHWHYTVYRYSCTVVDYYYSISILTGLEVALMMLPLLHSIIRLQHLQNNFRWIKFYLHLTSLSADETKAAAASLHTTDFITCFTWKILRIFA